jgi:DNA uptake protein ComE-like DNA-binding protein
MPIFFSPDGQGVQVHEMQVSNFLAMGYRIVDPNEPKSEPSAELIKVNSASLKELTEKLGLTTAQSKEVRDSRPYASVGDLIAKISAVPWAAFQNISYEV